jgi:hypothetical protein
MLDARDLVPQRTKELQAMRDRIRLEEELRAARTTATTSEPVTPAASPSKVPASEDGGPTAWAA